ILAAMSGIGLSFASRAISRSVGNVTATPLLLLLQARQHLLAPPLRRLDLVEREHVESRHLLLWQRELRHEARRELARLVAARLDHAHQPVRMAAQEARRVADADARR